MSFAELVAQAHRTAQAVFGEVVTYTPAVGAAAQVTGIFDEQFVLAKGSVDAGVDTLGPAVFLRLEDLSTDPRVDEPTLTIRGLQYRVIDRRPDGMGGVVLAVRRVT